MRLKDHELRVVATSRERLGHGVERCVGSAARR